MVVVASITAEAIIIINSSGLHSPPRSISGSGLHSSPCNIIRSSRRCINSSSSSSIGRENTLAGGDHRVFVSVAASSDTSM